MEGATQALGHIGENDGLIWPHFGGVAPEHAGPIPLDIPSPGPTADPHPTLRSEEPVLAVAIGASVDPAAHLAAYQATVNSEATDTASALERWLSVYGGLAAMLAAVTGVGVGTQSV
ncbi:MAG TPA: hypothetical protein DCQ04_07670 [Actinobacteria bacterium]|nr:hypothetical protein [Actinomycetota bacterium]